MYTVTFIPRDANESFHPGYWRAENSKTGANAHALTAADALATLAEQEGDARLTPAQTLDVLNWLDAQIAFISEDAAQAFSAVLDMLENS